VASLRPISTVFFKALELWNWGRFEAATCRSRLPHEPRVRTCFTCLRTMSLSSFSKNNQRKISYCRDCIDGYNQEPNENEWVNEWLPVDSTGVLQGSMTRIGTGFDVFDINPRIRIGDIAAQPQDVPNVDGNNDI
jgi:hypothetical protein